jgi:uncharacterized membrane protein YgdD (TMEM256/DUF423 family)
VNRALLVLAGLCGAAGVALAARASHAGGAEAAIAANFLLFHAPALIGLSLVPRRMATIAGYVLAAGVALFAGDLVSRDLVGHALFAFAAPAGGGALILGWLLLAVAGLTGGRDRTGG